MSCYLEFRAGEDKLGWLEANNPGAVPMVGVKYYAVCYIDNGHFNCVAVGYSEYQIARFQPNDGRYKKWFLLNRELILERCKYLPEFEKEIEMENARMRR